MHCLLCVMTAFGVVSCQPCLLLNHRGIAPEVSSVLRHILMLKCLRGSASIHLTDVTQRLQTLNFVTAADTSVDISRISKTLYTKEKKIFFHIFL
uniref:Putative secreted protein n=1 Tax=Ixodes ricinus TaxID=34613 RepID=A0A6B0U5V5_IXORI